ncbi:hypothetical protein BC941DRAFT_426320 [Chlamydoabsidia padenii]|nr:hypothetical protein BC941DRAFT_426320 [Chlamydoabsidia padenii]
MTECKPPLLCNSNGIMQELLDEINEYIQDQSKATLFSSVPSTLSSANNVSIVNTHHNNILTDGNTDQTTLSSFSTPLQSLSQSPILLEFEGDHDDLFTTTGHTYRQDSMDLIYSQSYDRPPGYKPLKYSHVQLDQTSDAKYSGSVANSSQQKPTTSFCVSAKFTRFAGRVKQTFAKTPRTASTLSKNQQLISPKSNYHSLDSPPEMMPTMICDYENAKYLPSPSPEHSDNDLTYNNTSWSTLQNGHDSCYDYCQDGLFSSTATRSEQYTHPQHTMDLNNELYQEQQVTVIGQPVLTPTQRIGEPHTVALRTRTAHNIGSHGDRINAYCNAYQHCIVAGTDMAPWVKKQYAKGEPSLMMDYTPQPRKPCKTRFGLFKRHSQPATQLLPSTSCIDLSQLSSSDSSVLVKTSTTLSIYQQNSDTLHPPSSDDNIVFVPDEPQCKNNDLQQQYQNSITLVAGKKELESSRKSVPDDHSTLKSKSRVDDQQLCPQIDIPAPFNEYQHDRHGKGRFDTRRRNSSIDMRSAYYHPPTDNRLLYRTKSSDHMNCDTPVMMHYRFSSHQEPHHMRRPTRDNLGRRKDMMMTRGYPPILKQHSNRSALHELCVYFHQIPTHVLAHYLYEAHGDVYLAKDLCMQDIMSYSN